MTKIPQQVDSFSNVCVSMLWVPAVNLGGIYSFAIARLGQILHVNHQRQALLPWPMSPCHHNLLSSLGKSINPRKSA